MIVVCVGECRLELHLLFVQLIKYYAHGDGRGANNVYR